MTPPGIVNKNQSSHEPPPPIPSPSPLDALVEDKVKTALAAPPVRRRHALVETPRPLVPIDGPYCLPVPPVRHLARRRVR